ncbi:hypothetical protein [Petroclostridium sp. X23]|uniref:hypothetical protein n=1 Tax=Petroclostridium sp. X23 TaxID=3045146 RepID=UPI0024ADECCD|nr:hypothetical protein [Petroclostridium sp. X23]WHH60402.1 hypothetical protein QKW49_06670 [Petroclostridium sp. X23]
MKQWFYCPHDGTKLCQVTPEAKGVFVYCKRCRRQIEAKYNPSNGQDSPSEEQPIDIIDMLDDEVLKELEGKNLLFYDPHHGSAYRLNKARQLDILRLYNSYTTILQL